MKMGFSAWRRGTKFGQKKLYNEAAGGRRRKSSRGQLLPLGNGTPNFSLLMLGMRIWSQLKKLERRMSQIGTMMTEQDGTNHYKFHGNIEHLQITGGKCDYFLFRIRIKIIYGPSTFDQEICFAVHSRTVLSLEAKLVRDPVKMRRSRSSTKREPAVK